MLHKNYNKFRKQDNKMTKTKMMAKMKIDKYDC